MTSQIPTPNPNRPDAQGAAELRLVQAGCVGGWWYGVHHHGY